MTTQEATDELRYAIDLIKQDGKDWLDERDIPVLEMAISALQAQEAKHSKESSSTQKALDTISRQAAIETARTMYERCDTLDMLDYCNLMLTALKELPSAQPEPLSDAYTKAVWTWLLDYQIKVAELKGRYTPYEVLSWVANDWRKEHE